MLSYFLTQLRLAKQNRSFLKDQLHSLSLKNVVLESPLPISFRIFEQTFVTSQPMPGTPSSLLCAGGEGESTH